MRIDDRDLRGGEKKWQWVKRGVPLRVEVGPRDMAGGKVSFGRRDVAGKLESSRAPSSSPPSPRRSTRFRQALFDRALKLREAATVRIDSLKEFEAFFTPKNEERPEIHGGLAYSPLRRVAGDGREAQGAQGDGPLRAARRRRTNPASASSPASPAPPRRVCEGVLKFTGESQWTPILWGFD